MASYSYGQNPSKEQLAGTWIGVRTEWDSNAFCPLPVYIQLEADGTYRLGTIDGSVETVSSTWAVDSLVRLDTVHFAPKLVTLENDLLRIGTNYPLVFRRFTAIPLDSATAHRQLSGRVWQSDSLSLFIHANGQLMVEDRKSSQRTAHFWQLARFGTSLFLIIGGNQYRFREGNYKFIWQLGSLSPTLIQAIGSNGRSSVTQPFRLVRRLSPGDSCRPSGFQPCANCLSRMMAGSGLGQSHKRYELNQLLATYYKPIIRQGQSGIIRLQFVINCEGAQGMYHVSGFDADYCPKTFSTQVTSQLLDICRNYLTADRLLSADERSSMDVPVSFTIRLEDGQITDILP